MLSSLVLFPCLLALASAAGDWEQITPQGPYSPPGRAFHSQASLGFAAVVFGGTNGTHYFNDLFGYKIHAQTVHLLSNGEEGPSPRAGACGLLLPTLTESFEDGFGRLYESIIRNETFVVFGGFDGTNYLNDMWHYNLGLDTWTEILVDGTPAARAHHTCVFNGLPDEETISVFGGKDADTYYGADDFSAYHVATPSWSQWPNQGGKGGPTPRAFISGVNHGGALIFFGGYDGTDGCLDELWEYKFGHQAWVLVPTSSSPGGNAGYAGLLHMGERYEYFGGYFQCSGTTNSFEYVSVHSKDWQAIPANGDSPLPRAGAQLSQHGASLTFLYGGADGSINDGVVNISSVYNDLWVYDPVYDIPESTCQGNNQNCYNNGDSNAGACRRRYQKDNYSWDKNCWPCVWTGNACSTGSSTCTVNLLC